MTGYVSEILIPDEIIMNKIFLIRERKVMLDRDLAELYQIETKQQKESLLLCNQWGENREMAPVLYTRTLGKGRIVVNILGHDEEALRNPSVRTLTVQSLKWLFSEE